DADSRSVCRIGFENGPRQSLVRRRFQLLQHRALQGNCGMFRFEETGGVRFTNFGAWPSEVALTRRLLVLDAVRLVTVAGHCPVALTACKVHRAKWAMFRQAVPRTEADLLPERHLSRRCELLAGDRDGRDRDEWRRRFIPFLRRVVER